MELLRKAPEQVLRDDFAEIYISQEDDKVLELVPDGNA